MNKLILIRHGESLWNKENIFTGWTNVDLSKDGEEEAHNAAKTLMENKIFFDVAFTSVLRRAERTLGIILGEMDIRNLPVFRSWRLNERHYGALQGLNKAETALKYGEDQVKIWRRSYDVRPPALKEGDPRDSFNDPEYSNLKREEIPLAESLEDTTKRIMPYWEEAVYPEIKKGRNVILVGHGSGIRSIVKYLDDLSDEEVMGIDIPTGIPLIYEFEDGKPMKHYYLGNQKKIKESIEKVKSQGKILK